MRSLCGQAAYKRFYNSVPADARHRYHRLNIQFPGPEPALDDAAKIPELKECVANALHHEKSLLNSVIDSMISSMFYFELDVLPNLGHDGFACNGYIYCRLDLPSEGLRQLYIRLDETESLFLIQGNPVRCSQGIPPGMPPFKKRITFKVHSRDELIAFSVKGITSTLKLLSGFPTSLGKLIEDQRLDSPFGTIDHVVYGKPLPPIPAKRSSQSQATDGKPLPAIPAKRSSKSQATGKQAKRSRTAR